VEYRAEPLVANVGAFEGHACVDLRGVAELNDRVPVAYHRATKPRNEKHPAREADPECLLRTTDLYQSVKVGLELPILLFEREKLASESVEAASIHGRYGPDAKREAWVDVNAGTCTAVTMSLLGAFR
jgi:hypothetical protein